MLFNSVEFLVFFAVFYSVYLMTRRWNVQFRWLLITVASFFFYGWWSTRFLLLLISTGVFDFTLAQFIHRSQNKNVRRTLVLFSLVFNLGLLFSFKYSRLFVSTAISLSNVFGWHALGNLQLPSALAVLPIGISFYTFESLSYVFDVYRGHLVPTRNLFHYFSFLSMFPRLIAGPIERPSNLLPQLERPIELKDELTFEGLQMVCLGYFKKVVLADNLALIVNTAFANGARFSTTYWWYVIVCFAFQIYFDFSGYSDIAIGLAQLMGFRFRQNFNHPYVSTSMKEFWTRWHISLSTWFRDYVYIPLGGDRRGRLRTHINLWVTMVTSGLWHGASWTFAVWGALHALYASLERITGWPMRLSRLPGGVWIAMALNFLLVLVAWVFFRASSFHEANMVLHKLFVFQPGETGEKSILLLALAAGYEWIWFYGRKYAAGLNLPWRTAMEYSLLVALAVAATVLRGPAEQFIYFQF